MGDVRDSIQFQVAHTAFFGSLPRLDDGARSRRGLRLLRGAGFGHVPELDLTAVGSAVVLLLGGTLVVLGRRRHGKQT